MHPLRSVLLLSIHVAATLCHFAAVSDAEKAVRVDPSGGGDFTTVQAAIDSVPNNNDGWTQISIKAGTYSEKINIPREKQFIHLKGEGINATVIQWGDHGDVMKSPTFSLYAENSVASDITFENTYTSGDPRKITWNPAALISADKVSFYHCGFTGVQDTLTDLLGRHYYESCFIKGAIDFIWGQGQSMYKDCVIYADAALLGSRSGYITAQGRDAPTETSGFVFKQCTITGTGTSYLGRAYGNHSSVIFYQSKMDKVIVPGGWSAWNHAGQEGLITYSEEGCTGPGADLSHRVTWMKKLGPGDLSKFTDLKSFIDQDGWLEKQPH